MMEKIAAVWFWCGAATQAWWYAANAPLWSALILMFIKQRNFSLKLFVSTGLSFTKRHKAECLMRFYALSGKSPISCLSDIEMGQLADSCPKKSNGILLWPLEISAELRLKVTCFCYGPVILSTDARHLADVVQLILCYISIDTSCLVGSWFCRLIRISAISIWTNNF